jgi:hypothetical protein
MEFLNIISMNCVLKKLKFLSLRVEKMDNINVSNKSYYRPQGKQKVGRPARRCLGSGPNVLIPGWKK